MSKKNKYVKRRKYYDVVKETTKNCIWINDSHTRFSLWEKFEKIGLYLIMMLWILKEVK